MSYSRIASILLPFALVEIIWLTLVASRQPTSDLVLPPRTPPAGSKQVAAPPQAAPPSTPGQSKTAFTAIYTNATWGKNAQGVPNSGTGSTVAATVIYRTFLQQFLKDNAIHSVVDAGCGDWEFSRAIDWTGVAYKGYDIVETVIEADKRNFAKPNIQFFVADIVNTELPAADLLIIKHVLQHLPTADVQKLLQQVSRYKHALLTDGVNPITLTADNLDIPAGDYRELDVMRPPFNLSGVKVLTYWDGLHMHQVVHTIQQPTTPNVK